jgi:hypothetical protein
MNREKGKGMNPFRQMTRVVTLKEASEWGLKSICVFNMALAAKILWTLINNEGLWGKVMKLKYLKIKSIEEWFRM